MNVTLSALTAFLDLGWILVHSVWVGGLIAMLAAFALALMQGASSHAKYCVLVAALFSIPTISVAWTIVRLDAPAQVAVSSGGTELSHNASSVAHQDSSTVDFAAENADAQADQSDRLQSKSEALETAAAFTWKQTLPIVAVCWLVCVCVLSLRLILDWCFLRSKLLSGSCAVSDLTQQTVESAKQKLVLRRWVAIRESTVAIVPMTFSFLRPMVLLPVGIAANLTPQELEAILLHEFAHIRRHDFFFNCLQVVVETLMFYHPAVWWLSSKIRNERENACDDVVLRIVDSRTTYARALTAVAANAKHGAWALNLAADGGFFRQRIRRIVGLPAERASFALPTFGVGWLLLAAGLTFLFISSSSQAPAEQFGQPSAETTETDQGSMQPTDQIGGTILGDDGKPLAGATVYLRSRPYGNRSGLDGLGAVTTADDGRFVFEKIALPPLENAFPLDVIAMKMGHGIRWQKLTNSTSDIILRLRRESTFRGFVVDGDGRPIPNARVRVRHIMSLNTISKIDLAKGHTPSPSGKSFLDISDSVAQISATTNPKGEFVLDELPNRVGLVLEIDDPRLVKTRFYAATTDLPLPPIRFAANEAAATPPNAAEIMLSDESSVRTEEILKSGEVLNIARGRQITLYVLDFHGAPVVGATIRTNLADVVAAKTDELGIGRVVQLPQIERFQFTVVPPDESYLLDAMETLQPTDFDSDIKHEIHLKEAAIIAGRVSNSSSDRGIAGVRLSFGPWWGVTDDAGRFRLRVPDGATSQLYVANNLAGFDATRANPLVGTVVTASIEKPVDEILLTLDPIPSKLIQLANGAGEPIVASIVLRIYYESNSWMERQLDVDSVGIVNVADYITAGKSIYAVQLMARNAKSKQAAFFRTEDVDSLSENVTKVTLQPTASLIGQIIDSETGKPIANAVVHLGVNYTPTMGQGVAAFTTESNGRFHFEDLVPTMTYSIGARAENHIDLNSIHTKFLAESGDEHEIDLELAPAVPSSTPALTLVTVPQAEGKSAEERFEFLLKSFDAANKEYRKQVEDAPSRVTSRRIVALREPTPAYADAIAELVDANRDSDLEMRALLWLVQLSEVAGSSRSIRPDQTKASARIMAVYSNRAEIAGVVSNVIYASPDPYATALKLMESPHREVRGRACLTAADLVANKLLFEYRDDSDLLRERAVELYQQVVDNYADIDDWRHETLGNDASIKLFRLEQIRVGKQAPEIEGNDLHGLSMKLSDFQGKVVVIHHWHAGLESLRELKEVSQRFATTDVVILGVNINDDANDAIAATTKEGLTMQSWFDPDEMIHSKWSSSIPIDFVVDRDGVLVYTGQRQSSQPLLDVVREAVAKSPSR